MAWVSEIRSRLEDTRRLGDVSGQVDDNLRWLERFESDAVRKIEQCVPGPVRGQRRPLALATTLTMRTPR